MTMTSRFCVDCGTDITNRGNRTQRCQRCQRKHRKKNEAERQQKKYDQNNKSTLRLRLKKRMTIGHRKTSMGGRFIIASWTKGLIPENETGKTHADLLKATCQNEVATTTIITMKGDIVRKWSSILSSERLAECNAESFTCEEPPSHVELYRNWRYWQRQQE